MNETKVTRFLPKKESLTSFLKEKQTPDDFFIETVRDTKDFEFIQKGWFVCSRVRKNKITEWALKITTIQENHTISFTVVNGQQNILQKIKEEFKQYENVPWYLIFQSSFPGVWVNRYTITESLSVEFCSWDAFNKKGIYGVCTLKGQKEIPSNSKATPSRFLAMLYDVWWDRIYQWVPNLVQSGIFEKEFVEKSFKKKIKYDWNENPFGSLVFLNQE